LLFLLGDHLVFLADTESIQNLLDKMSWTENKKSAEALYRQADFHKAMEGYAAAAAAANLQKAGGFQDPSDDESIVCKILLKPLLTPLTGWWRPPAGRLPTLS
jgi:hypothetical protein